MIDRKKFFAGIRSQPFSGKLSKEQVAGTTAVLDEWEKRKLSDLRQLAYMLATAKWETAHTMQPIAEKGGNAYFTKMYDPKGSRAALAKRNGNVNPGDGIKFRGRGYVQLTWRANYRTMGRLLKVDLEGNPDLAMRPAVAAQILFEGMIRGTFTGNKLADYFTKSNADWMNARCIVNRTDKAAEIAGIAKQFHSDLGASS